MNLRADETDSEPIRFASSDSRATSALPMAPMVDIVFLLICFFMLATEMVRSQKDPTIDLPVIQSDESVAEAPAEVTINLAVDGAVRVGAAELRIDDLRDLLTDEHTRATQQRQPMRVVIRADRRQRYRRLDRVLEICRELGISHVTFRAERDRSP